MANDSIDVSGRASSGPYGRRELMSRIGAKNYDWFRAAQPEARDRECRRLAEYLARTVRDPSADFHGTIEAFVDGLNSVGHALVRYDYDDDPDKQVWVRNWRAISSASGLVLTAMKDPAQDPSVSVHISWSSAAD
jgi:hypothetical protein